MRLISYTENPFEQARVALLQNERVIDIGRTLGAPHTMLDLLQHSQVTPPRAEHPLSWLSRVWEARALDFDLSGFPLLSDVTLSAPLPAPSSVRDFYAFETHVRNSRARRGLEMIPEWYDLPVFYFSNHQAIAAPEAKVQRPRKSEWLDLELEVAAVIGREGRDIPVAEASQYIAGYTIMNDWSARDIQRREMAVGLGPAKGKDFATSLGPWLVTPDELEDRRSGKGYDLEMIARRNGKELSRGNWNTIHYSFEEMIARASEDTTLYPGDVIGSGTVGTGCILELGPDAAGGWLRPGDTIELEIERLGTLRNQIA